MNQISISINDFDSYTPVTDEGWEGWIIMYKLDACENCGGPVQAANSMKIKPADSFLTDRLNKVEPLPVEGYYSEETDGEACYSCNA
jgi:hypothetical protein